MFLKNIFKISIISVTATQLLFANTNMQNNENKKIQQQVIREAKQNILTKYKAEREELKNIFIKIRNINMLFQNKKYNEIKLELKNAINTLNNLLNKKIPKIFPIGAASIEYRYIGKTENVNKYLKISEVQFKAKNMVATRTILDALRDEIDTRIFYIPLVEYKKALETALKYINEKKYNIAQSIINNASRIIYTRQYVKPIPVLMGIFYINHANTIIKISKQRALQDINKAKKAFEKAYILGYIPNKDLYKNIIKNLNEIEKTIKTKNKINKEAYKEIMQKQIVKLKAILNASSDFMYIIKNTKN